MKQNSAAKNAAQIAVLTALTGGGVVGLMAIPDAGNPAWFITLCGTKALAAASLWAAWRLAEMWRGGNRWLQAYEDACRADDEVANPICAGKEEGE